MADCIEDNAVIADYKRVAKQLRYATYLIDRIETNYDDQQAGKQHAANWGEPKYYLGNGVESDFTLPDGTLIKGCGIGLSFSKVKTKQEHDQATREWHLVHDEAYKKKVELRARLFKHMDQYIERWWD